MTPAIDHAADLIEQADALIIAAGAGMGVDSGLPDFRGKEGFWRAYPALKTAGIEFEKIASPRSFKSMPSRAWGFYGHRLALYRQTTPHRGFGVLKRWGARMLHGHTIFTSNVDGQFQRAGFDASTVHECHGSIHHLQCSVPCSGSIWSADSVVPQVDEVNCELLNAAPRCPNCGQLARPNILMFGDWDWVEGRVAEQAARQESWLSRITRPVVIELGAGTAIPSVRAFSERVIHEFDGRLIRINPAQARVPTSLDVGLAMGAAAGLEAIARVLGDGWMHGDGGPDAVT